ncbi:MAG TPA: dihydrofolate reductase family protein, partial [Gaiellaceae bacterium]|nr:dihydrofolate reductase family protein [Gaiellaceae bacterium]
VNDQERGIGTYLYGRRMYETMAEWETLDDEHPVIRDYADIWRAADKVVFSTTLDQVRTARTRVERRFDPDAIRVLKAGAPTDISIGGPELASHALAAGLVDEIRLLLVPVIVGAGKPALRDAHASLELADERRFASGVVHLHYRVKA